MRRDAAPPIPSPASKPGGAGPWEGTAGPKSSLGNRRIASNIRPWDASRTAPTTGNHSGLCCSLSVHHPQAPNRLRANTPRIASGRKNRLIKRSPGFAGRLWRTVGRPASRGRDIARHCCRAGQPVGMDKGPRKPMCKRVLRGLEGTMSRTSTERKRADPYPHIEAGRAQRPPFRCLSDATPAWPGFCSDDGLANTIGSRVFDVTSGAGLHRRSAAKLAGQFGATVYIAANRPARRTFTYATGPCAPRFQSDNPTAASATGIV